MFWAPMVLLESSPSFAQSFFARLPALMITHNPELTEGLSGVASK